jgi:ribonuclease J
LEIIVHKGNREIGGTCIQLSTKSTTILLDVGRPLSPSSTVVDVGALHADAVLVSHSHQDHFGLITNLPPETPVYIGKLGKNLIDATHVLLNRDRLGNKFRFFKAWEPFQVGDCKVTPYLMDHSAIDAYAFLIEAAAKRIFYSGDFRSHGRKGKLFDHLVQRPLPDIDVMFLEGTMMNRSNDEFPDEVAVEAKIQQVISSQSNISFLISSSQNIDRIVSAFRACKKTAKTLVIDIYTAWVLEKVREVSTNVPGMEWDEIRVYADYSQDEKLKANQDYFGDFRRRLYRHRVNWQELMASPAYFLYFGKMSSFRKISAFRDTDRPVNVIYSQWQGYLDGSHGDYFGADRIAAFRQDAGVNFVYAHTSGHAPLRDLQTLATAMNPDVLVPIHTEHGEDFKKRFKNVQTLEDSVPFTFQ